jgi:hypothetical protein
MGGWIGGVSDPRAGVDRLPHAARCILGSCSLNLSTGLSRGKTYGRRIYNKKRIKEELTASSFAEAMEDGEGAEMNKLSGRRSRVGSA